MINKLLQTFTVYRTEAKNVVNESEKSNYRDGDLPQFQGVIFHDGTCAIRWFTEISSVSFWDSFEDMKKVHITAHPDYGTIIKWSNGITEIL